MPLFHREAYEAACRGEVPSALTPDHFETWEKLEEALLWLLTDEQRSDAIYGDWLLQLNNPGGTERLAIKSLLIGNGALAANYLAELAQNANDAADGEVAEIRVVLQGDWLVFANNGRKITPLNQIGLCRFFRHFDPGLPLMQVIGQFGVGFKSSFRIADEVFVESWGGSSRFAFRLPITSANRPHSLPNEATRQRILDQLKRRGVQVSPNLLQPSHSGFCTPEAVPGLPTEVKALASKLCAPNRGAIFCFHLHQDGKTEVASRIQGQSRELYELNPIFLQWLRTVQVGPNTLTMTESKAQADDGIEGQVEAVKVTLGTTLADGKKSNSRFWRLKGLSGDDRWQLALHADSDFNLRIERANDEQGLGLKEGAAYAFFPLNKVGWPFRFHLHIELQPNLARDDWNPNLGAAVEEQIKRAIRGLTAWVEKHADRRHPNWRIEDLVRETVSASDRWARVVWETLLTEVLGRPLLKTVWGTFCRSDQALTVRLFPKDQVRKNWEELCAALKGLSAEFPLVNTAGAMDFGLTAMGDKELKQFFLKAAGQCATDDAKQKLVTALFTIEDIEPSTLEEISQHISIPSADGPASLASLCQRKGGCELSADWHRTFETLRSWLGQTDQNSHGLTSFFWGQLRIVLKTLAAPVFNPNWTRVPEVLSTAEQWVQHGATFWGLERDPCPVSIRGSVLGFLRIKDGNPAWTQLDEIWLADTTPPLCFHGVVRSWNRGGVPNYNALRQAQDKLRAWGLWEAWEDAVEERLKEKLCAALTAKLRPGLNLPAGQIAVAKPFEQVFEGAHLSSMQNLTTRWRAVVQDAEKQTLKLILRERGNELPGKPLLPTEIPEATRTVLSLTGNYANAPFWLTSFAVERIKNAGEFDPEKLTVLWPGDLDSQKKREAVSLLLASYHKWEDRQLTPAQIAAFNDLCLATPPTLRGNWSVGLTSRSTVLLKDLLNPQASTSSAALTGDDLANLPLLQHPSRQWLRVQELPTLLQQIPAIAEASLQASQFTAQVTIPGHPLPITLEQVDAEVQADPLFRDLLASAGGNLSRCGGEILVRWLRGEDAVAELRNAPYAINSGTLFTNRASVQTEDRQFTEVLALYSQRARPDETFQRFQQVWQTGTVANAEIYSLFRNEVKATLLKSEVTDLGYRKHHVVRELLQNAESAYDSMAGAMPQQCSFELFLRPPVQGFIWQAVAAHVGRPFNENLKTGEPRDDIRLIVRTPSAESPPTEGWVGRFNRGFKSIFTVADSVEVTSGAYRFTIQDMLLLNPSNPARSATGFSALTTFAFRCSSANALKLFKLPRADGDQPPLAIFNPSSFVFLSRINEVRLHFDRWTWEWTLSQGDSQNGWSPRRVRQTYPAMVEQFLIHQGHVIGTRLGDAPMRFAVALRVDEHGLPLKLEDEWRKIRLTFETEDEFPLSILVNGDFEAEPGRLGVRNNAFNANLFAACLKAAVDLCEAQLGQLNSRPRWTAWAEVLGLHDGESALRQRFEGHHDSLLREHQRLAQFLCSHVPHAEGEAEARRLKFPTRLCRKLEPFIQRWGFATDDWIDAQIEDLLPSALKDKQAKQSLDGLVSRLAPASRLLQRMQVDMNAPEFQSLIQRLPAPERDELDRAQRIIQEKLRPVAPEIGATLPAVVEEWSVSNLLHWWRNNGRPMHDYTLDGANWPLLYPDDDNRDGVRTEILRRDLLAPDQPQGKALWYRIFGLACLMSAGRRMTEVRSFWEQELNARDFWTRTSGPEFADGTDSLFDQLLRQPFADAAASGENAYFWRRIFYDLRKIHQLVWQNDFASVFLELASNPSKSSELLTFLRSGRLIGQPPWVGVFGQSAGSPLFFLVRELRRVGVLTNPDLDRLAFFVCAPVRRAAQQIGWLESELSSRADFVSLAEISDRLYERIANDGTAGSELLKDYDIPLLHYGLTN